MSRTAEGPDLIAIGDRSVCSAVHFVGGGWKIEL
jgi:hypothetical protein